MWGIHRCTLVSTTLVHYLGLLRYMGQGLCNLQTGKRESPKVTWLSVGKLMSNPGHQICRHLIAWTHRGIKAPFPVTSKTEAGFQCRIFFWLTRRRLIGLCSLCMSLPITYLISTIYVHIYTHTYTIVCRHKRINRRFPLKVHSKKHSLLYCTCTPKPI